MKNKYEWVIESFGAWKGESQTWEQWKTLELHHPQTLEKCIIEYRKYVKSKEWRRGDKEWDRTYLENTRFFNTVTGEAIPVIILT